MSSPDQIRELLLIARRRRVTQLVLDQAATALTLAMSVFVLLLLLGTQVLDWYWPVVVFILSLSVGVWRTMRRVPDPYEVLQHADAQLGFHDALSTAWFFADIVAPDEVRQQVRVAQRKEAEALARTVDPKQAVPLSLPRSAYIAIVAVVVAGSFFGLRYGVRGNLDLRPPVSQALIEFFRPSEEMVRAWEEPPSPQPDQVSPESPVTPEEKRRNNFDRDDVAKLTNIDANQNGDALSVDSQQVNSNGETPEDFADAAGSGESLGEGRPNSPFEDTLAADSTDGDDAEDESKFPENEDTDLIRKMRDALANLMNRMKVPPMAGKKTRRANAEREAGEGEAQKTRQQMAQQTDGQQQGQGTPSASPDGAQMQQAGQQAQPGEAGDEQSDLASQQSASGGAGQKDGAKELRAAAQMEAMGKLEEILGKRAEDIKGDIMVEVSSGPQRLRTEYTESEASHGSSGTAIHRDEIPLVLQPYIERYFEELRKTGE